MAVPMSKLISVIIIHCVFARIGRGVCRFWEPAVLSIIGGWQRKLGQNHIYMLFNIWRQQTSFLHILGVFSCAPDDLGL